MGKGCHTEDHPVGFYTLGDLSRLSFAAGSMAPKVQAACDFVQATGRRAVIGALTDIEGLLSGSAGTQIEMQAAEAELA